MKKIEVKQFYEDDAKVNDLKEVIASKKSSENCLVVYGGETVQKEVMDKISEYKIVFLAGATYLGNSYRHEMVSYLQKNVKSEKVIILVPEPRVGDSWSVLYDLMGRKYNQIRWELSWLNLANIATLWLPCYFSVERAGPGFMQKYSKHPNSGRTVWLEVGYLMHRYSMRKDIKLLVGAPADVRGLGSTKSYKSYFDIPGKFYTLELEEKMSLKNPQGKRVSEELLIDLVKSIDIE